MLKIINDTGYLIVGVFFGLSGYGLYKGIQNYGEKYLDSFLKKRIFSLLLPWIVGTFVYVIGYHFSNEADILFSNIRNAQNGFLIISHTWYIVVQIILYILFYIAEKILYRINKHNKVLSAILSIGYTLGLIFVFSLLRLGAWWYYSLLSFPVGIVLCFYENNKNRSRRNDNILLIISVVLFVLCYIVRFLNSKYYDNNFVWLLCRLGASAFAALFFLVLNYFVRFESKTNTFIARYSYSIYIIHMFFFTILRSNVFHIECDSAYLLLVITLSVCYAMLIGGLQKLIQRKSFGSQ